MQIPTIENGFSFVRPTYNVVSYATDYNGRVLTQMDSDYTDTGIMYATIPTQRINTLYARVGDLLGTWNQEITSSTILFYCLSTDWTKFVSKSFVKFMPI